jgi:hypothetical protein
MATCIFVFNVREINRGKQPRWEIELQNFMQYALLALDLFSLITKKQRTKIYNSAEVHHKEEKDTKYAPLLMIMLEMIHLERSQKLLQ